MDFMLDIGHSPFTIRHTTTPVGCYFKSLNFTQHFVIQIGALIITIIITFIFILERDCGSPTVLFQLLLLLYSFSHLPGAGKGGAALHFRRSFISCSKLAKLFKLLQNQQLKCGHFSLVQFAAYRQQWPQQSQQPQRSPKDKHQTSASQCKPTATCEI